MRKLSHSPKTIFCVMLGLVLPILAGCSSEPSASDVEKAVKADIDLKILHGDPAINAIKVKKLGCVQAQGKPGYMCDLEVTQYGARIQPYNTRLTKGSNGWIVAE